jgi:hypothetical protein
MDPGGQVYLLAGTGLPGFLGDGSLVVNAELSSPVTVTSFLYAKHAPGSNLPVAGPEPEAARSPMDQILPPGMSATRRMSRPNQGQPDSEPSLSKKVFGFPTPRR